jgi:hypothetical protein
MAHSRDHRYRHGAYHPLFPKKYTGHYPITVRSSWEERVCRALDLSPIVVEWRSEPFAIRYKLPDGTSHRYFPDFYVKIQRRAEGEQPGPTYEQVWEVKPSKDARKARQGRHKKQSTIMYEQVTYIKNVCKWAAAKDWCKQRNYEFVLITEKSLFGGAARQGSKP